MEIRSFCLDLYLLEILEYLLLGDSLLAAIFVEWELKAH
jgi:hypothetical protein